jgi:ribonucleoside-diphosphate reductase alpha chain
MSARPSHPFDNPLSEHVWEARYRYRWQGAAVDGCLADTHARVAIAVAAAEREPLDWGRRFVSLLEDFRYLPAGRILAGAGTRLHGTLINCFVMGPVGDSAASLSEALKEGAETLRHGGGIGYDFSTLRPAGDEAPGPVAVMRVWDETCATVTAGTARGGAMMATLRVDHPDIARFVAAKRDPAALRHFNVSVQVTDAFLAAVHADEPWPLVYPDAGVDPARAVWRPWTGGRDPVACRIHGSLPARDLWKEIVSAAWEVAEPGVLFVDAVNRENNLAWLEVLSATNPCGEEPLPPYGACDLGSLNLAAFVRDPFGRGARLDLEALEGAARTAVRFLDDVLDVSRYPLDRQRRQALATRRVGLGVTGLADALAMLGLPYDSEVARARAAEVMERIKLAAYATSVELAAEKGPFPAFQRDRYLAGTFIRRLPLALQDSIAAHGIRNSHLLALAPAGSISVLANNVSSGIEPVFALEQLRRVRLTSGKTDEFRVADWAWARFREHAGPGVAHAFRVAAEVAPLDQLAMQAALQPHVDGAISKTINLPAGATRETVADAYEAAHRRGLKGCTVFRPNPVTGAVLEPAACDDSPANGVCGRG